MIPAMKHEEGCQCDQCWSAKPIRSCGGVVPALRKALEQTVPAYVVYSITSNEAPAEPGAGPSVEVVVTAYLPGYRDPEPTPSPEPARDTIPELPRPVGDMTTEALASEIRAWWPLAKQMPHPWGMTSRQLTVCAEYFRRNMGRPYPLTYDHEVVERFLPELIKRLEAVKS